MQNNLLKTLIIALFLVTLTNIVKSQELDPTVDVNMDRISIDVRDRLATFKQEVTDYLSRTRFTDEQIVNDVRGKQYKIKCNFQFTFSAATGFDSYQAQVFIGSSRNIFKTANFSQVLRVLDEKWEFNYVKGQSMYHDDQKFNSLDELKRQITLDKEQVSLAFN